MSAVYASFILSVQIKDHTKNNYKSDYRMNDVQ